MLSGVSGENDKLPALAADLIKRQVAVIVTPGSTAAAVAAKAATLTIPIILAVGGDPVELGLVTSLNRPGGNAAGKRFEPIRELVPQAHYFGLVNPASPLAQPMTKAIEAGAITLGIPLEVLRASSNVEIDAVLGRLQSTDNVIVSGTDAFFYVRRAYIAALALRQALPTIFDGREYVTAGALAAYGADFLNVMELAGDYTGRVLKGQKPTDLPAVQAEKFEFVIKRKNCDSIWHPHSAEHARLGR